MIIYSNNYYLPGSKSVSAAGGSRGGDELSPGWCSTVINKTTCS